MRTSNVVGGIGLLGLVLAMGSASGFDGTPTVDAPRGQSLQSQGSGRTVAPPASATPQAALPQGGVPQTATPQGAAKRASSEALRSGTQALRDGKPDQAVTALQYAAEQGSPGAIWKLGRMYADGDGVGQDKLRAFEYFKNLTKTYSEDSPGTQQAPFVASAFVALGHFYLEGIAGTVVKSDASVAREMFHYAASYYGDPEAQFQLGRLYVNGTGIAKDARQAARWFKSAADKGHRSAQAMLGTMLFNGQGVTRQVPLGLAWLTVAKEGARTDEAWISDTYKNALAQATADERVAAGRHLEELVKQRRK
jgi:uncharacterized protein